MKIRVTVRIYEELNSFLPESRQKRDFSFELEEGATIQQLLSNLELPLSQVDLILVNGESVGVSFPLKAGDRISIYPVFERLNIAPVLKIRPAPLRKPRFICDVHLGKLATYMRMAGLDADYRNNFSGRQLIQLSVELGKIILTKNRGLLKNKRITHGYLVIQNLPKLQLAEIISCFDLKQWCSPLSRCLRCNLPVHSISKDDAVGKVAPRVLEMHDQFMKCDGCSRVYWKGTHYESMMSWISRL